MFYKGSHKCTMVPGCLLLVSYRCSCCFIAWCVMGKYMMMMVTTVSKRLNKFTDATQLTLKWIFCSKCNLSNDKLKTQLGLRPARYVACYSTPIKRASFGAPQQSRWPADYVISFKRKNGLMTVTGRSFSATKIGDLVPPAPPHDRRLCP